MWEALTKWCLIKVDWGGGGGGGGGWSGMCPELQIQQAAVVFTLFLLVDNMLRIWPGLIFFIGGSDP